MQDAIGIPACFSSALKSSDDHTTVTRSGQSVHMSVYRTKIADHCRLITITWCKNLMLHGLSVAVEGPEGEAQYSCKVELKPWYFWRKQGSKRFLVHGNKAVDVFWDLKAAKFNGETEPISEYYVAVVCEQEVVLLVGDLRKEAYRRTGCRPALIDPILVSKKEHIFGKRKFSTRAKFHEKGRCHEISIECKNKSNIGGESASSGVEVQPEMEIRLDGHVVIHVKHLQSSKEEALFFLESHNFDLDAAVSTFLDNANNPISIPQNDDVVPNPNAGASSPPSDSHSPDFYPSRSPSHSPTPSPSRAPYELRSRRSLGKKPSSSRQGKIRTLGDLKYSSRDSDSDSDPDFQPDEYYTGGQNSGMLVRDPSKGNNSVDDIFQQARDVAVDAPPENPRNSSQARSFSGSARLLSGETVPSVSQRLEEVTHTVTFWRNGFSVNDGPLRRLDDPQNAPFLESIKKSVCPKELEPADRRTTVHVSLTRRDEDYPEPVKPRHLPFQGVGRTLGGPSSGSEEPIQTTGASPTTAPLPTLGLVVDESQPITSIQLRLADGTRMVSRFNHHHTIRDVRAFIDASRPGGVRSYQLQAMGFPPKQLTDLDQSIEQAGIANSVVIQKL